MHTLLEERIGEQALLLGNDAIAGSVFEAGVALAAESPGTPSSAIVNRTY